MRPKRRRTGLLAIAGVFALAHSAPLAETPEETFSRGNAAYERGSHEEAAEAYRTLIRYGIRDARVEYNLGNAEYKLGRLGEAILHYQRAQRLAPTDPDIRANLELARSRCFDRVEPPELAAPLGLLRSAQDRLGPDRQALAVVLLVWLLCAWVGWRSIRPGGWNAVAGWTLAGLLLVLSLAAGSWYTTSQRFEGKVLAVVLENSVEVLAGPSENNAVLFTVHEGLTLEVRSERQEWLQVSLPNGLNGWVPERAVGRV